MASYELFTFHEATEMAKSVADRCIAKLQARNNPRKRFCIALSGGRIAGALFDALAELFRKEDAKLLLDDVHFFWADERCVPPNDPESNFRLANERLFIPSGIAASCVHRVRGEEDPLTTAAIAEAELRSVSGAGPGTPPVLDLIFLGMGEDGHTASLFPGESEDMIKDSAVYRCVVATKPPPRRVTLGYETIVAAQRVWVLISGPGKAKSLTQTLENSSRTPLGHILHLRRNTLVFVDRTVTP
jgi:6-phosphogluconolactonase